MPDARMNVAVAISPVYVGPLKVMLRSLAMNTGRELHIFLLHSGLDAAALGSIGSFVEKECHGMLHVVPVDAGLFEDYLGCIAGVLPVEVYYRLLLPYVLEPGIERILWMDSDMVVCGDIDGVYDTDMGCRYLCAAPDRDGREHAARLGFPAGQAYFNSGLLLLNLPAIRNDISREQMFEFLASNYEEKIRLSDQDTLNCLLGHNALMLDERIYNNQNHLYGKVARDARVIHFVQNIKPWKVYYCGDRYAASCFWEFAQGCGFKRGAFFPAGNAVGRVLFPVYERMKSGRLYAVYHKLRYGRYPYRG